MIFRDTFYQSAIAPNPMKSRCYAVSQHLQTCAKMPCQGEGRGFESRLALSENEWEALFYGLPILLLNI